MQIAHNINHARRQVVYAITHNRYKGLCIILGHLLIECPLGNHRENAKRYTADDKEEKFKDSIEPGAQHEDNEEDCTPAQLRLYALEEIENPIEGTALAKKLDEPRREAIQEADDESFELRYDGSDGCNDCHNVSEVGKANKEVGEHRSQLWEYLKANRSKHSNYAHNIDDDASHTRNLLCRVWWRLPKVQGKGK